jgi:DNA-binding NarL/FixJ family response regulator
LTFEPSACRKTRILIVDDHPLIRGGLVELVGRQQDMEVCGEAGSGREALNSAKELDPDLIVLDLTLGDMDGMDVIHELRVEHSRTVILVLSKSEEAIYAERALRAGANGYVMKHERLQTVLVALRRVRDGGVFLSDPMQARVMSQLVGKKKPVDAPTADSLSDRELQVIEMIGRGMGASQIAKQLHLSVKTIDSHRARIKTKFGLKTAADLRQFAIAWCQGRG